MTRIIDEAETLATNGSTGDTLEATARIDEPDAAFQTEVSTAGSGVDIHLAARLAPDAQWDSDFITAETGKQNATHVRVVDTANVYELRATVVNQDSAETADVRMIVRTASE